MSDKDKHLIKQAECTHYSDWDLVSIYMEQADTEEARAKLKSIRSRLYHTDEYHAGCL